MVKDIAGHRFGRLVVVSEHGRDKYGNVIWSCKCDCGKSCVAAGWLMRRGVVSSCGCLRAEGNHKTHGKCKTAEYAAWFHAKARCYNKRDPGYRNYGARGIRVCGRWLNSFENFIADMGLRPTPKHSIDRIDNDGDYSPENCRWATSRQQNRNYRRNTRYEYGGENLTLVEWAERYGLKYNTLWARIKVSGWSFERAILTG